MFVTTIPPTATHALRRRVLRDNRADADVVFPGDDAETTVHFGAFEDTTDRGGRGRTRREEERPIAEGHGVQASSHELANAPPPLAVASLYVSPLKDQSLAASIPSECQFQFRGMASAPEVRGKGYADAVMRAMIDRLRAGAPALLWCNARLNAVGFYERFGMGVRTTTFDIAGVGPHVVMTLLVE